MITKDGNTLSTGARVSAEVNPFLAWSEGEDGLEPAWRYPNSSSLYRISLYQWILQEQVIMIVHKK